MKKAISQFFGAAQFIELKKNLLSAQQTFLANSKVSPIIITIALVGGLVPLLSHSTNRYYLLDMTSVAIGSTALIGWLISRKMGSPFLKRNSLKKDLRLTHYAFAFGCIPGVLLLLTGTLQPLAPTDILTQESTTAIQTSLITRITFILSVAFWAAVTEELIFRALLIGALRRLRIFSSQIKRDFFAIVVSAGIFALGHSLTWGPTMGVALFGIGLGLGVAYIATREHLFPLIVYHFGFDALSLTVILWLK